MAAPVRQIGLVGLDRRGWHRLEQLSLRDDWHVVAVTDSRADRRAMARVSLPGVVDSLAELLAMPHLSGVIITEPPRQRVALVDQCLSAGKDVWVEPPIAHDLRQVRRLQSLARQHHANLFVLQPERFEADFQSALAAVESGKLGALRSIRLTSAEWTTFAGDSGAAVCPLVDPIEQFGPHGFDQLLGLVQGDPHWIWSRRFTGEDGFLAVMGFTSGTTVQIEIRRRSRATLNTGWVLDGETASYQQGRIISVATDGELIDESVTVSPGLDDPFLASLMAHKSVSEAEQRRNWLTVALMLGVQKSSLRNTTVRWDEVVGG